MPNLVQTYALLDTDPGARGAFRIKREQASEWNSKGYGIFHTVQEFRGPRRVSNLVHINAWAVDVDVAKYVASPEAISTGLPLGEHGGNPTNQINLYKQKILADIQRGLIPTMVVETKNGFHIYWKAKDATQENWKAVMEHRLVPYYQADKKAKDLARILRTPGYYHLKNPAEPFLVRVIHSSKVEYSEREMLTFYPDVVTPEIQKKAHRKAMRENPGRKPFWEAVWNLDCEDALTRLSGSAHVGFETYTFRENASGTKNIYVNGKSTSCWIDREGRIGSMDEGGPTIAAWLNWFHKDWSKTIAIIKEVFPECQTQTLL